MKKYIVLIIVGLLLPSISMASCCRVKWGASEQEVLQKYPDGKEILGGISLYYGNNKKIKIEGIFWNGVTFGVYENSGLKDIFMSSSDKYEDIRAFFVKKYGDPVEENVCIHRPCEDNPPNAAWIDRKRDNFIMISDNSYYNTSNVNVSYQRFSTYMSCYLYKKQDITHLCKIRDDRRQIQ